MYESRLSVPIGGTKPALRGLEGTPFRGMSRTGSGDLISGTLFAGTGVRDVGGTDRDMRCALPRRFSFMPSCLRLLLAESVQLEESSAARREGKEWVDDASFGMKVVAGRYRSSLLFIVRDMECSES